LTYLSMAVAACSSLIRWKAAHGNSILVSSLRRPYGNFSTLDHVDLMDVDIQGGEREVLPVAMDVISQKVKRILLATHSADLHQAM